MQPDTYLALLRKSNGRFTDVSAAELEFERICDQRRLPMPEVPITSTGARCAECGEHADAVDRGMRWANGVVQDRALGFFLRRRWHPLDRCALTRAGGAV